MSNGADDRHGDRDDDRETEATYHALGAPRQTVRQSPRLTWSDSAGAHAHTVSEPCVLGSGAGVSVRVADTTVSRLHAELDPRPDGLWIRDLGSRNGTWIAGVRVVEGCVPAGATVRVGQTDLRLEAATAPAMVSIWPDEHFGPLVGRSLVMRELFARLARVAPTESTVLVQGETGTGKELVARSLHDASPRSGGPFVVVDCGAIPETLIESELFGHARGAFTGASDTRAGAIELAAGGTLFLDEVGELPLAMQPKLLRALESRSVRRLGEASPRAVDVRFVSATHRDLRQMVNAGAFREDLYFRLAVLPVSIPPLRARAEDIPLLAAHFMPPGAAVSPDAIARVAARPWLGNVRELRNFVERVLALGEHEALELSFSDGAGARGARGLGELPAVPLDPPFRELRQHWLDHLEREYVRGLLGRFGGNVSATAQHAGLTRAYVHRLIRKHEID